MSDAEFVKVALAHYDAKLGEETQRFGVLGISEALIENNAHKVVDPEDGAGQIWQDLSKQSGLCLHVDYACGDPQSVYAILSRESIPRPESYYELWNVIAQLRDPEEDAEEKIDILDLYDGPYKLEVPEELL